MNFNIELRLLILAATVAGFAVLSGYGFVVDGASRETVITAILGAVIAGGAAAARANGKKEDSKDE